MGSLRRVLVKAHGPREAESMCDPFTVWDFKGWEGGVHAGVYLPLGSRLLLRTDFLIQAEGRTWHSSGQMLETLKS